jgi:hypothetical protein
MSSVSDVACFADALDLFFDKDIGLPVSLACRCGSALNVERIPFHNRFQSSVEIKI